MAGSGISLGGGGGAVGDGGGAGAFTVRVVSGKVRVSVVLSHLV